MNFKPVETSKQRAVTATSSTTQSIGDFESLKKKPLHEWIMATSIIGIIAAVFCGRLIFDGITSDTTGLCAIILVVFVAALVKSFFDARFIARESNVADKQIKKLIALNDVNAFIKNAEKSLFRNHVYNLAQIGRRDLEVSQDNLIALLQTKLNAKIQPVEIASTLLTTIGLIGTIAGLIGSVSGLEVVVDSVGAGGEEEGGGLMEGLKETLGGMGTAFYTTLIGAILGGIALRILSSVVASNSDFLVGHIAELSEVYIVPSIRKTAKRKAEKKRRKAKRQPETVSSPISDESLPELTDVSDFDDFLQQHGE